MRLRCTAARRGRLRARSRGHERSGNAPSADTGRQCRLSRPRLRPDDAEARLPRRREGRDQRERGAGRRARRDPCGRGGIADIRDDARPRRVQQHEGRGDREGGRRRARVRRAEAGLAGAGARHVQQARQRRPRAHDGSGPDTRGARESTPSRGGNASLRRGQRRRRRAAGAGHLRRDGRPAHRRKRHGQHDHARSAGCEGPDGRCALVRRGTCARPSSVQSGSRRSRTSPEGHSSRPNRRRISAPSTDRSRSGWRTSTCSATGRRPGRISTSSSR